MTTYKDTLNLPITDFPMKASLANREPKWLEQWQSTELYQKIRSKRQGAPKFILHDGPPYANGHLHSGHALNKILKDIIIKSKTLAGYDAPFVPGWDCHGLPIELNVEKKYGKAGNKLSVREFRQKCRDYAKSQVNIQREEFKRFGILADWSNPYITMDFAYEANTIRALGKIIEQGHLHQGFKPVHWCLDCGSSLAEAEVEYEDKTSPSIDVRFDVINRKAFFEAINASSNELPLSVPIWTTTPWTLPANQAVSVNAELDYVLVELKDKKENIVIAEGLLESVMARYENNSHEIKARFTGSQLEGQLLQHPLFNERQVPIILGEHVSLEAGTGCVHTAPAHGPDDYIVGLKYNLPLENPVMANGCYAPTVEVFAGLYVAKADKPILDLLASKGKLIASSKIQHSYPHCWRHKSPIIFRATPQWFVSMTKAELRSKALKGIDDTQFIPSWGRARIEGMIATRPDWCISRQRSWGTPIPLFIHKETGELHPNTNQLVSEVANLVEKEGIDAWFELETSRLLGEEANDYDKVTDTLDVWFDSGVSHFAVLQTNKGLHAPADLYLEGSDQHRGWFNSSLMTACAMEGKAPYKTVLTHGYAVDKEGKKMSKSKGNYIAPEKLISQSGADILRLWVASTDYQSDVHISDEILKRTADAYRRIRNTCRFLLSNLFDFNITNDAVPANEMVELDIWAISKVQQLQKEITTAYEAYDFHVVYQKLLNFCTVDMGSFYLDVIKDRLYTSTKDSNARRSSQTAMYYIIESLTRLMAPILSFTAHEVWSFIPCGQREDSVFLSTWYDNFPEVSDTDEEKWQTLRAIRDVVNKALEQHRKEGALGSALEASVSLFATGHPFNWLTDLDNEIRFVLITSEAKVLPLADAPEKAQSTDIEGVKLYVTALTHEKCERCWHRRSDVGTHESHINLCQRCVGNVTDKPEQRQHA